MTIDQIKQITTQIGKAIAEKVDPTNPDEISGKLAELTNLLASSAHCVASSESIYSERIAELLESGRYDGLNTTEKKLIMAAKAKNEAYYVALSERQNKAITHSIDGLRSILSYLKSEMQNISS